MMAAVVVGITALLLSEEVNRARVRIVLDVDTPSGPVQGSTVLEIEHRRLPDFWGALASEAPTSKGEAVFVDLGGRRMLVGLLTVPEWGIVFLPVAAFGIDNQPDEDRNARFRRLAALPPGTSVALPSSLTPGMLVLQDVRMPASARAVSRETFEAVLGRGYRLRQARLQIVAKDTPINDTIRDRLPWWDGPDRPALTALRAAGFTRSIDTEETFTSRVR